jgi:hypothetical protein
MVTVRDLKQVGLAPDERRMYALSVGRLYEAMKAEAIAADEKLIESERREFELHQ